MDYSREIWQLELPISKMDVFKYGTLYWFLNHDSIFEEPVTIWRKAFFKSICKRFRDLGIQWHTGICTSIRTFGVPANCTPATILFLSSQRDAITGGVVDCGIRIKWSFGNVKRNDVDLQHAQRFGCWSWIQCSTLWKSSLFKDRRR